MRKSFARSAVRKRLRRSPRSEHLALPERKPIFGALHFELAASQAAILNVARFTTVDLIRFVEHVGHIGPRVRRSRSHLLFNPSIKLFSENLFIASPFPVDDDSQWIRWLRSNIDLRHSAFDLFTPWIGLDSYDVAISFEQTQ